MNQLLNMIMRMFIRKAVNKGINTGIKKAGQMRKPKAPTVEKDTSERDRIRAQRRARRATRQSETD